MKKGILRTVLCGAVLALGSDGAVGFAGGVVTITISMKGRTFHPEEITVNVGDTVLWINDDTELHQVISGRSTFDRNAGSPMNSGILIWNQQYAYTFNKPGTYPYMCAIHRSLNDEKGGMGMVGEIVVASGASEEK